MARKAEEAENHWPGYVDALSTIIMVFIFLVILLGVVIFALSQNIAREMVQVVNEAQQAKEELRAIKEQQAKPKPVGEKEGTYIATPTAPVMADEKQDDGDRTIVLARPPTKSTEIIVAPTEQPTKEGKVKVETSQAMLTLMFSSGVEISQEAAGEIGSFIKSNPDIDTTATIEIRAFANSVGGSISEARRLAYYRALATRNELLGIGVKSDRISLKVSVSDRSEDRGAVRLYLK